MLFRSASFKNIDIILINFITHHSYLEFHWLIGKGKCIIKAVHYKTSIVS